MITKTSCKGCCFLKENKCELGRHEKFLKNRGEIVLEDGFPVINNRFCMAFRPLSWAKEKDNVEVAVRNEILVSTHVFIYSPDWKVADITKTVKSLNKQLLRPGGVTIIGTRQNLKSETVIKLSKYGNVVASVDPNYDCFQCLDAAIDSCKSYFYILMVAGSKLPSDFLANIDEKINDDLEQFVAIEGQDGVVYGASLDIHKKYHGNKDCVLVEENEQKEFLNSVLLEKINFSANRNNQFSFVKSYMDFL